MKRLAAVGILLGGLSLAADPTWIDKNEDESYTARHECSFVQAGDRFYLFGGRESPRTLDTYDYAANSWSTSAQAPISFNHFQATEYDGLVWVIGAFETNNFPNEDPADEIWVYDPARDVWMAGPTIPVARRRGSTGLVVHHDRFYVIAGNTIGHNGGYVPWFDTYDPATGEWTPLADAPGARDHFHAAVVGDRIYAVGGRLSGGDGGTFAPLIAEVDAYDLTTESWSRLPLASNLPTPRAASAVAYFNGEILVIGGEGNGQAYDTVEGFDPVGQSWTTRASLSHPRHGTQAIVSGQGLYVTAGSPNQGGGNQHNMEVYGTDTPAGVVPVAGELGAPLHVTVSASSTATVLLSHAAGNQGVFVTDVALTGPDATDFLILTDVTRPFLVRTGGERATQVEYTGGVEGATASLEIVHGGGEVVSVALTGTLAAAPPGRTTALRVERDGAGLLLSWDTDCGGGTTYGIYRGALSAGYDSLSAEQCDVAGNSATIPSGTAEGEFFLVVPSVNTREGSYGRHGDCAARAQALVPCHLSTQPAPCADACADN